MAEQESRLSIVIDSAKAEARIKELRKQLQELGGAADQAADDTGDLGNRADRASRDTNRLNASAASGKKALDGMAKAAALAGAALAGVIGVSVNKAIAFESAMAEVNKTVDFATNDGLANMRKELQALTTEIPQSFEELAGVAAVAGQLGIAEKDIVGFTETIAKMGVAFDMSSADAADSMAKIANVFALPIENVGELGDTINTLSNSMASTAPNIIDFMMRSAALAKTFKLSADDTAAFGSALVALGWQPETASTAFNSMLMTLSDLDGLSKSGIIGLQQLGLDTAEFAEITRTDGKGAILEVIDAVNMLDESSRIAALSNLFGKEAAAKIASMATGLDTVNSALAATTDTAGSMQKEFEAISGTTANKIELFKNNIDGMAASIGDAFIPALNDILLAMTPIVTAIGVWTAANPELLKQIISVTAVLLSSIVGLKLFADGIMAVRSTIEGLKVGFAAAKAGLAILSGGFALPLLAIGALIAAGVLLYQNWDYVKEKASELNEYIKSVFGSLPEPLQQAGRDIAEVFMFIWNTGKEYLTLMSELYSGTFESFKTIATGVFQAVWSVIKVSFSGIVNTVSTALQLVATLFSGGFALIKNTVSTVLGVIKAVISGDFKAIPGIIGNGLKGAVTIVGNMMGQILDVIKNYGKKLYSIGRDFIQGFINGIKSIGSGVVSAASTMAGNAIEAVRKRQQSNSPAKATIKLGKDLGDGYIGGIKSKAKAVKTEAQKMAEGAIEAVQTGIDRIKKEIALFGNNSNLADLEYDIGIGKYKGASEAQLNEYRAMVAELERLNMAAGATLAIQARFAQLKKATENSETAFNGLDINQPQSEAEKLRLAYQEKMAVVDEYERLHTDKKAQAEASRQQLTENYNQSIRDLELQKQSQTVGSIAAMFGMALGETSKGYQAMFAVQKAYDFVQAQSASFTAIAKAWSSAPFPANLPAVATTTLSTGIIPAAIQALSPKGFKTGGYTGNMGVNQVAGAVHGQEYVFDAASTKRIGVDNLNAMRSGKAANDDSKVSINIVNNSSAQVTASDDGQTITITDVRNEVKRGFTNLQNPNSYESKQINRNVQAPRRR
ncbi:phage tail tape measure protein [Psychrobacter sp. BI730]|uniref:phage tail tape measure protein n=1 Tax=Psychrobacter sp. BI730 TaxID=2705463 RepID=UPI0015CBD0B8|nr:phage tail tape measure protein [Psychrobacter sp. BI730]NYR09614.1 phage tail tape measure protein [Psychrobacter sp. BI730]